jgi:FAD/FMN-containing dehydrogenase
MRHAKVGEAGDAMRLISRRALLTSATAFCGLGAARSAPALILNDASHLNPTSVAGNAIVRDGDDNRIVAELRALLNEAARDGRPVCVGGARHSMGGQSLPRGGIAISLETPLCEPNEAKRTYRARGGTRWHEVIRTLDPLGYSVAVMQSNNDFSVAGTLGVNAHGWPVPFGPFGATVHAVRLMLADGSIVSCSRTDNAELFSLVIGGYGLFGIVLDVEVEMIANVMLVPTFERMPAAEMAGRLRTVVEDAAVNMAYGRLSIAAKDFLQEALVVSYRPVLPQPRAMPLASRSNLYSFLSRQVYRGQVGSERGKEARWYAETALFARAASRQPLTRNAILSYPVSALAEANLNRADILHEYFIPPERFADFLTACREIIPSARQDLINVTLRHVEADRVSVLAYAPSARIAAVMSFSQEISLDADRAMAALTERLIEAVIALGGTFYLPYRLHARPEQVRAAYPQVDAFIAKKRHYDPQLRFRNMMWDKYFA